MAEPSLPEPLTPSKPTLRMLTRIFFVMLRIGAFTFGGGYAMIPQMSRDFVDKQGWVTKEEIVDLVAVAQSLPGILAVNASIMVGYRVAGRWGAVVACIGSILPSFVLLALLTPLYHVVIDNRFVLGAMKALRAAVAGLLLATVFRLFPATVARLRDVILFLVALALMFIFPALNLIFLLLGGIFVSFVWQALTRRRDS